MTKLIASCSVCGIACPYRPELPLCEHCEVFIRYDVVHVVKCVQPYFDAMFSGVKLFDCRKHDRNYAVGDIIIQIAWDAHKQRYLGPSLSFEIVYLLSGGQFGVLPDYCVLGLQPVQADLAMIARLMHRSICKRVTAQAA